MTKIDNFVKNPTQAGFEELNIVGDVVMMNHLYNQAPHLAKRYFKCEDWLEMCQQEKKFNVRTNLLQNAVDAIASIEDCKEVFREDRRAEFYEQIKKKAVTFCVSFDDILATICTFELTHDPDIYNRYGKKLVQRAIPLIATPEDVDVFSGIIPRDDEKSLSKFTEKAVSVGLSFPDDDC